MRGDTESRVARPILVGLAIALGAVAASALLSRFRMRLAGRTPGGTAPYTGWMALANVLAETRGRANASKPTIH